MWKEALTWPRCEITGKMRWRCHFGYELFPRCEEQAVKSHVKMQNICNRSSHSTENLQQTLRNAWLLIPISQICLFYAPGFQPSGMFFLDGFFVLERLSVAMFVSIGNCSAIIAGFLAKACRRTDQWIHALMILHRLMAWKLRPAHRPVWWSLLCFATCSGAGMANMFATCCNTMKSKQFQY